MAFLAEDSVEDLGRNRRIFLETTSDDVEISMPRGNRAAEDGTADQSG
jgi:hypothetical protein